MELELWQILLIVILIALGAFGFASWLYYWVKKQPSNNEKIAYVGELIKSGANTFLKKEYIVLAKFAGIAAVLIFILL
ncbi:MAG: sodium/proton-translocating pyrophosphatase, partial [Bacilli bacterium]|nr:sodium/proton-translocating pyrophosphatase [Bacilli bacterium]